MALSMESQCRASRRSTQTQQGTRLKSGQIDQRDSNYRARRRNLREPPFHPCSNILQGKRNPPQQTHFLGSNFPGEPCSLSTQKCCRNSRFLRDKCTERAAQCLRRRHFPEDTVRHRTHCLLQDRSGPPGPCKAWPRLRPRGSSVRAGKSRGQQPRPRKSSPACTSCPPQM